MLSGGPLTIDIEWTERISWKGKQSFKIVNIFYFQWKILYVMLLSWVEFNKAYE